MAAIVGGDILTKYSVAAAAGNTTAGTAATSLGDQVSTTAWAGGTLNDLFDEVSGAENAASESEYRCIFVHNTNGANAWENVKIWLSSEVAGGASIAIGADTTAASAVGSASAQAVTVANEDTAPAGITFTAPTTEGAAVSLGTIGSGQVKAFWVRRTTANTSAVSNDGVTFTIKGDTGAL